MTRRGNGEGSIYRRRDGRWCASLYVELPDGRRRRKDLYGATAREVKARLRDAQRAVEDGSPIVESSDTISRYATLWASTHLVVSGRKQSTIHQYSRIINFYITPLLGHRQLRQVTPTVIEKWITDLLAKGLSGATVRSAFNVLSAILRTAQRDGLIRTNPCMSVKRPTAETDEAKHLSPDQVRAVVAECDDSLRPLVTVVAYTGMRIGEALALRWQDLSVADKTIRISGTMTRAPGGPMRTEPKTPRSMRTIPATVEVIAELRQLRKRQMQQRILAGSGWHDNDLVFTTSIGTPRHYRNELRGLREVMERLGFVGGFHVFRHSAATTLLDAGVPTATVSSILGHSRTSTTMDVYAHVLPETTQGALDILSAAYRSDSNRDSNADQERGEPA